MSEPKVAIATPVKAAGSVANATCLWISREAAKGRLWLPVESYSIAWGRCRAVDLVRERCPDATHIMFIDSDVEPPNGATERLLNHDKDIVFGVCPQVMDVPFEPGRAMIYLTVARTIEEGRIMIHELPQDLFEVEFAGGACLLVRLSVFDKIEWPYFKMQYSREGMYFPEDFWFCWKARQAGFEIYADPLIQVKHHHSLDVGTMYNITLDTVMAQHAEANSADQWAEDETDLEHPLDY